MNHKPYELQFNDDCTRFQFQSIGKRGIFEKVVLITQLSGAVYNLSLLDYDPTNEGYDDSSTTDNGDMQIVLATVISAIKIFTDAYSDRLIYFEGSTPSRTRLYQISIAKFYHSLKNHFNIYGRKNEIWMDFEPNITFDSFLIQKNL